MGFQMDFGSVVFVGITDARKVLDFTGEGSGHALHPPDAHLKGRIDEDLDEVCGLAPDEFTSTSIGETNAARTATLLRLNTATNATRRCSGRGLPRETEVSG
jgi:hypothetical protein